MGEQYDGLDVNEAGDASEWDQPSPVVDDALGTVLVVSVALVLLLASALGILYLWTESDGTVLGGPPAALLAWEDEYRELTGMNDVGGLDGSGVVMCVVDSGIDLGHPDLDHIVLLGWKDAVNQAAEPYDDEGHGTAMAGIIVADGSFEGGAKGVELLVAKAIDDEGIGSDQYVSESVDWCVDEGADIISLSLGGDQGVGSGFFTTDSLEQSVEDALDNGVFVIAAAGNDGQDDDGDVESPGSVEDVICVGGITRDGGIWTGSSKGDNNGRLWPNPILPREDPDMKPEVVAPGHEVPVLMATGVGNEAWWGWSSGTSAATAWMSGAIALLLEHGTELQRENSPDRTGIQSVKSMIKENSQMKEGQSEHDDHYGYGHLRVDFLISSMGEQEAGDTGGIARAGDVDIYAASFHSESVLNRATSVPPVSSTKPKA